MAPCGSLPGAASGVGRGASRSALPSTSGRGCRLAAAASEAFRTRTRALWSRKSPCPSTSRRVAGAFGAARAYQSLELGRFRCQLLLMVVRLSDRHLVHRTLPPLHGRHLLRERLLGFRHRLRATHSTERSRAMPTGSCWSTVALGSNDSCRMRQTMSTGPALGAWPPRCDRLQSPTICRTSCPAEAAPPPHPTLSRPAACATLREPSKGACACDMLSCSSLARNDQVGHRGCRSSTWWHPC